MNTVFCHGDFELIDYTDEAEPICLIEFSGSYEVDNDEYEYLGDTIAWEDFEKYPHEVEITLDGENVDMTVLRRKFGKSFIDAMQTFELVTVWDETEDYNESMAEYSAYEFSSARDRE